MYTNRIGQEIQQGDVVWADGWLAFFLEDTGKSFTVISIDFLIRGDFTIKRATDVRHTVRYSGKWGTDRIIKMDVNCMVEERKDRIEKARKVIQDNPHLWLPKSKWPKDKK